MGNGHNYPSDITREQFELIRGDLEAAKRTTRPRRYDLYDIFCAVMYIVKSGAQWRMLPADFPSWKLVYYYFSVWNKKDVSTGISILDGCLKKISAAGKGKGGKAFPRETRHRRLEEHKEREYRAGKGL